MQEKRYSIVRVERMCPEYREEDFICPYPDKKEECLKCEQYRYGETKEQFIVKIKTVLDRITKCNFIEYKYRNKYFLLESNYIAKEIVEFLGVKE